MNVAIMSGNGMDFVIWDGFCGSGRGCGGGGCRIVVLCGGTYTHGQLVQWVKKHFGKGKNI